MGIDIELPCLDIGNIHILKLMVLSQISREKKCKHESYGKVLDPQVLTLKSGFQKFDSFESYSKRQSVGTHSSKHHKGSNIFMANSKR